MHTRYEQKAGAWEVYSFRVLSIIIGVMSWRLLALAARGFKYCRIVEGGCIKRVFCSAQHIIANYVSIKLVNSLPSVGGG